MLEQFFIDKSQQLVFYVSRYLRGQLPHREIHLFIWDTLEEWSQLQILNHTPANRQEQVSGIYCINWNTGLKPN